MAIFTTIRMKINALKVSDTNYTQIRRLQNLYVEKNTCFAVFGGRDGEYQFCYVEKKSFLQN